MTRKAQISPESYAMETATPITNKCSAVIVWNSSDMIGIYEMK